MAEAEIAQLEALAQQSERVASIPYENPSCNPEVFYDFIRAYGQQEGLPIVENNRAGESINLNKLVQKEDIYIAPNPVNEYINIYMKYTRKGDLLQVINSQGNIVHEKIIKSANVSKTKNIRYLAILK